MHVGQRQCAGVVEMAAPEPVAGDLQGLLFGLQAVALGTGLYYLLGPSGIIGGGYSAPPSPDFHFGLPIPTLAFTRGIVSALNRPVVSGEQGSSATSVLNAIQTDAAVNPGNSGGALVDMAGRVVGINSAIASLGAAEGTQGGSIGLGFAIPIDQAKRIADQLTSTGTATKAVLGVASEDAAGGAKLTQVADDGAAAKAGLQVGDVVTQVGTARITGTQSLLATVRSAAPGSQIDVTYTRDGAATTATVTLGSADVQA